MNFKYKIFTFLFILLTPLFAKAEVMISEVAWMGTSDSANDEWIELYNNGSSSVSLSGWTLNASDGTPSINLSGSIDGESYALLERTDDFSAPGFSALVIYTGALSNDGETLILKNSGGTTIQSLNFSSGWPAGDPTSKNTMQWNGSSWITALPTPGSANSSSGTNDENNPDENEEDSDDDELGSSPSASSSVKKIYYKEKVVDIQTVDSSVPVGSPVQFSLKTRDLKGANIIKGDFFWNMGDGTERYYSKNEKFEHTYDHEGTYVVVLKYYETYFEEVEPEVVNKVAITVGGFGVEILKIHKDGSIEIKNKSGQEIDLSFWSVRDSFGKTFIIPSGTYILAGKTLTLNSKRTRMNPQSINLYSPSGALVVTFNKFSSASTTSTFSTPKSTMISEKSISNILNSEKKEDVLIQNLDLNERLLANTSSGIEQKQSPSLWIIVFVVLVIGSSVFVFLLYKKEKNVELVKEDEFDLID